MVHAEAGIGGGRTVTNFFRTVSVFYQNPFINPYLASLRHIGWAFRKIFNLFPCEVQLGDRNVRIPNRAIANGSGALANAMGYYDPNNMFFIEEIFQNGVYDTFFDIGSNIGIYSLIAAGRAGKSKAFAFEPHPYTFALLNENVRLNHQEENILCYQVALSDQNGIVLFRDIPGHPENQVVADSLQGSNGNVIEVKAWRGDDFCTQLGLLPPQVVKIDVEGYENQVLSGLTSILNAVQLIFIECWALETTVDLLCGGTGFLGPYKIDYKNRRFSRQNLNYEDWVFVNPAALETLGHLMTFE
jgi:FkbM family methyltransferase